MAGTPVGFRMQTPGHGTNKESVVDMQPKGNLPLLKPDDMQYFDKLLVSFPNVSNCGHMEAQNRQTWYDKYTGVS